MRLCPEAGCQGALAADQQAGDRKHLGVGGHVGEHELPLADHRWRDVEVCSNHAAWNGPLVGIPSDETFHFEPNFGWKGRIENTSASESIAAVSKR